MTMKRMVSVGLALVALATVGPEIAVAQQERDSALAAAVGDFLTRWLIQRNPASAIEAHLSPLLNDARLLPAGAFSLDEYQERFGGERVLQPRAMSQAEARGRLTTYLQNQLPPDITFRQIGDAFTPSFSIEELRRLDPELWNIIGERGARTLPGLPAIAYAVRSWNELSWTNTGAIGLRLLLPQRIDANRINAQGVVLRILGPIRPYHTPDLMFLLWVADEKSSGWKFLGLEFPPTN